MRKPESSPSPSGAGQQAKRPEPAARRDGEAVIASALNDDELVLRSRVNGQEKQQERTGRLIHDVASTVSFISRYITLHPGDLIFTGTPGETPRIRPGDVVEVELEGVGVLRNPVVAGE